MSRDKFALRRRSLTLENQKDPFIRLARAGRIRFEGNVVSATMPMTQKNSPFQVFGEATPKVLELLTIPDRFEFEKGSSRIASEMVQQPLRSRQTLAKGLEGQVERSSKKLTTDELTSYSRLAGTLRAETVEATRLQDNLMDIRLAALATVPGVAIVLMDGEADTRIEDNNINGVVNLYGVPGPSRLTPDEIKRIPVALKAGSITFAESLANLYVRDNVLQRIDVSEATIASLKAPAQNIQRLTRFYRRCFITNNAFRSADNCLVAEHLALTSNSFEGQANAGIVIAHAAIYVGNYAPRDIRLFNLASTTEKVANLTINILGA